MSENNYKYKSLTNREIRSYAREKLLGNMLLPGLVAFFFFCTRMFFELILSLGVLGKDAFSFFFYIALFLVINSIYGLFRYGIYNFFLGFITKKESRTSLTLAGFRQSTEVILAVSFMLSLISLLLQLPYLIYAFFYAPDTIFGLGVSFILLTISNIFGFLINAYLSPIYFVICDYPGMRLPMVIVMTLTLMNKKSFFKFILLQLSFIPMYILGYISLGIGFLWIFPYEYTSYAYFYETLCEKYLDENKEKISSI